MSHLADRRLWFPKRPGAPGSERGDTLLEVLVAVTILSIAGAAVMGGFGSSIVMSAVHRKLAVTASDGQNFTELLIKGVDDKTVPYVPCGGASAYASPPGFIASPGDTASVTAVAYWNGSAFGGSCTVASDQGVQRITVSVTHTDTRAVSTRQVVIRKPCTLVDVTAGQCP